MKTSEQLNELADALAKAQGEIKNAKKDSKNPHFKNDYASLESVLDEVRPAFCKHGLSLFQSPRSDESGHWLDTRLLHKSGQWIEETMRLILFKVDMQGLGSAITYARRYSASALAGIHQTDDDAQAAVAKPLTASPAVINKPAQPTPAVAPKPAPVAGDVLVRAVITYSERDLPKLAGFKWDCDRNNWVKKVSKKDMESFKFKVEEMSEQLEL